VISVKRAVCRAHLIKCKSGDNSREKLERIAVAAACSLSDESNSKKHNGRAVGFSFLLIARQTISANSALHALVWSAFQYHARASAVNRGDAIAAHERAPSQINEGAQVS
jgi:hypothetical protein